MLKYYCPINPDQLLYEDNGEPQRVYRGFPVPENPVTCPICKLAYYKRECVRKEEK